MALLQPCCLPANMHLLLVPFRKSKSTVQIFSFLFCCSVLLFSVCCSLGVLFFSLLHLCLPALLYFSLYIVLLLHVCVFFVCVQTRRLNNNTNNNVNNNYNNNGTLTTAFSSKPRQKTRPLNLLFDHFKQKLKICNFSKLHISRSKK